MKLKQKIVVTHIIEWEQGDDWYELVRQCISLAKLSKTVVHLEFKTLSVPVGEQADEDTVISKLKSIIGFS